MITRLAILQRVRTIWARLTVDSYSINSECIEQLKHAFSNYHIKNSIEKHHRQRNSILQSINDTGRSSRAVHSLYLGSMTHIHGRLVNIGLWVRIQNNSSLYLIQWERVPCREAGRSAGKIIIHGTHKVGIDREMALRSLSCLRFFTSLSCSLLTESFSPLLLLLVSSVVGKAMDSQPPPRIQWCDPRNIVVWRQLGYKLPELRNWLCNPKLGAGKSRCSIFIVCLTLVK